MLGVWSRHFLERIEFESFWLGSPAFAAELVWRETFEVLEPPAEVVGVDEIGEMPAELGVIVVVISLDGRVLDRAVHAPDLAIGPWVIWLCEAMLNVVSPTSAVERMALQHGGWTIAVFRQIGELNAVISQSRVDDVRNGGNKLFEKNGRHRRVCLVEQLCKGELRRAVYGDEKIKLSFRRLHFGDVDVEKADRIGLELLLRGLVAFDLRQPADPVSLQTAMQRRTRQMRDRRLQGVEAIVKRQQRVLRKAMMIASSSRDSAVERGSFGPVRSSQTEERFFHLPIVF